MTETEQAPPGVDNDPMVAAHAGALLAADGTTTVITADLRILTPCWAIRRWSG